MHQTMWEVYTDIKQGVPQEVRCSQWISYEWGNHMENWGKERWLRHCLDAKYPWRLGIGKSKQYQIKESQLVYACMLSRVWLFETPWTVAFQTLLSLGFLRQESWSGLPFPPPGDLPDPGIKPEASPTSAGRFSTTAPPGKPNRREKCYNILCKGKKAWDLVSM